MNTRIAPASPPYPERVAEDLVKLMPPGMEPLGLFRTLAKNPRVLGRVRRSGLLDAGSITLRQREIVILRTTALARAEYEWGIHAAFFGGAAGLDEDAFHALVWLGPDAPPWDAAETTLLRACDELHATASLSDDAFGALRAHFTEEQVLEILALTGFYRLIAIFVNATGVALEEGAARFPRLRT
jgi:alkylhydroperoxidase family enzyme